MSINVISFVVLYLAVLLSSGFFLLQIFKQQVSLVGSLAISYAVFAGLFVLSSLTGLNANLFTIILLCIAVACASLSFVFYRNQLTVRILAYMCIAGVSLLYQFFFGSFIEVPADLFAHLERYQDALRSVEKNNLKNGLTLKSAALQGSGVFYYLVAIINAVTNVPTPELVITVDFLNRTVFLCAVYSFAKLIFRPHDKRATVAALTVLFVALHMGISVFSYIRYYTWAPSILAFALYYYSVSLFIGLIKQPSGNPRALILIAVLTLAASSIHIQEALFIIVMTATIAGYASLKTLFSRVSNRKELVFSTLLAATALIGFIVCYDYISDTRLRAPNAHWRLWDFGEGVGILPRLTVLNLGNQGIQVLTLWGLAVYALFLLHIKRYKDNLFIMAGMISPLFTILNPFFVDIFLRLYNSTTLWRLCFLIPVHFVAADLFLLYFEKLKASIKEANIILLPSATVLVTIILLLLPYKNGWQGMHYSRIPTLGLTDQRLTFQHYSDLLEYLEKLESDYKIVTDPMTGYMVSALTKHYSPRKKFFRNHKFQHFSFKDYSDNPLSKYKGQLLIINQRKKVKSKVGELGKHWDKNHWINTHHYYPETLSKHIEDNPQSFEVLWNENSVKVVLVK